MIRNTRANAGIRLPPRRAETVLFEPDEAEPMLGNSGRRNCTGAASSSQASLWGRLAGRRQQPVGVAGGAQEVSGPGLLPRLGGVGAAGGELAAQMRAAAAARA